MKDRMKELVYGFCLLRIIHFIVAQRSHFPGIPILIGKYDVAAAYRRATLWGTLAHHCIFLSKILANATVALMGLRITFGGTGGPFK